jgi:hypothetical protein
VRGAVDGGVSNEADEDRRRLVTSRNDVQHGDGPATLAAYRDRVTRRELKKGLDRLGGDAALSEEDRRVIEELAWALAEGVLPAPADDVDSEDDGPCSMRAVDALLPDD